MKSQILGAFILAWLLGGCSDVTPQVSVLRTMPGSPLPSKNSDFFQTDLASVGKSTSIEGYRLHAIVSKEDKVTAVTTSNGYKLILQSKAD